MIFVILNFIIFIYYNNDTEYKRLKLYFKKIFNSESNQYKELEIMNDFSYVMVSRKHLDTETGVHYETPIAIIRISKEESFLNAFYTKSYDNITKSNLDSYIEKDIFLNSLQTNFNRKLVAEYFNFYILNPIAFDITKPDEFLNKTIKTYENIYREKLLRKQLGGY